MGYELSIQRMNEENKITLEEWKIYINSDPEFDPINDFSGTLEDGKILTVSTPNAGLWKSTKGEVPFTFSEKYGSISVKNPENWIVEKMISIADSLDALVLGEEGEKYDQDYLDKEYGNSESSNEKSWWEFWK